MGTTQIMHWKMKTQLPPTLRDRLWCLLCQVLLLHLLEEFCGGAPTPSWQPRGFLGFTWAFLDSRTITVDPGAEMERSGGQWWQCWAGGGETIQLWGGKIRMPQIRAIASTSPRPVPC